jgi:large subunit ribosomal protein L1
MPKRFHSKRYRAAVTRLDPAKTYGLADAITLLASFEKAKFDETVDLSIKLGIDPKQPDQMLRGSFSLPKGLGRSKKVVVFASGEKAEEARQAGADEVGSDDLIKKVEGGWTDFDVAIAHPSLMAKVGKLGRVLGPQGKMPSPKSGTVADAIGKAVKEFKAGKIEFRNDDAGNLHVPVGKRSFPPEALAENIQAILDHVKNLKPAASKGEYLQLVVLSSTMSPGIRLHVS